MTLNKIYYHGKEIERDLEAAKVRIEFEINGRISLDQHLANMKRISKSAHKSKKRKK